MRIPFAKIDCGGNEARYLAEVLKGGWLTTASKTQAFEALFGRRVGADFSCAVNSGTAALHLALEAVGIGPGDEVLVPTMTFTATAEVVRYLGADPVFVDCDLGTNCVSGELMAEKMSARRSGVRDRKSAKRVKAVIPVHYGGQACEMDGILDFAENFGLKVVEDAAHAFPAYCRMQNGKRGGPEKRKSIGSIGDATCFSFYANKTITTGEGGMLTTNDPEIAERVKTMRLHGIDRDIWSRYMDDRPNWEYDVVAPGFKYNMPDVAAAIGLAQLERADFFREERERCARCYLESLADIECIDLPRVGVPMKDHAWHLFVIVLNDVSPVSRNRFIDLLSEKGIGTSVHYKPLHRMTYYRKRYGLKPGDFPNAEYIWRGCVSLPIYPSLSDLDLEYIVHNIKRILK
ncbi:MAG: DegT/DnrJ/EryC1/StrS family aminotransferase [Deltaproteobacteria bacterium]|nr:DegT/DnrJ/EryC1/StrS family aminotransferase [Deltaproteobacteria bacterium]